MLPRLAQVSQSKSPSSVFAAQLRAFRWREA